jgi:hypothetical protein
MEHLIKRYEKNWKDSLCGGDKGLYESVRSLLLYATVTDGLSLDDKIPESLRVHTDRLFNLGRDSASLICGLNGTGEHQQTIRPLEPDLIGEYFALGMLEYFCYTRGGKAFIAELWEAPGTLFFFDRCRLDFVGKGIRFEALFEQGARALIPPEVQSRHPLPVAIFLAVLVASQPLSTAEVTVKRLEGLCGTYENNAEIALEYAKGLVNLSNKQDEAGATVTVKRLEGLCGTYENNAEIALAYAKGLYNLSNKQGEAGAEVTVKRLEGLCGTYENNAEIALEYAKGLVNLSNKQDEAGAEVTVKRLEGLCGTYENNAEIALEYAKGLVNLAYEQDEAGKAISIERFISIVEQYGDTPEFRRFFGNLDSQAGADQQW